MHGVRVLDKRMSLGGWAVYDNRHEYRFVRGTFSTRAQAERAAAAYIALHPTSEEVGSMAGSE